MNSEAVILQIIGLSIVLILLSKLVDAIKKKLGIAYILLALFLLMDHTYADYSILGFPLAVLAIGLAGLVFLLS